jgi:hypothetical protein
MIDVDKINADSGVTYPDVARRGRCNFKQFRFEL